MKCPTLVHNDVCCTCAVVRMRHTHLHVIIARDDRISILRVHEVHDARRQRLFREDARDNGRFVIFTDRGKRAVRFFNLSIANKLMEQNRATFCVTIIVTCPHNVCKRTVKVS